MRIGVLSKRTGVAPELLRAWERRYGLLHPERTEGGFRLYTPADLLRIERMKELLAEGMSASDSARLLLASPFEAEIPAAASADTELEVGRHSLRQALMAFDEEGAQAALDGLLANFSVEMVLRDVILAELRDLGDRWERGEATVAEEHFFSNVLHGRLLGLARGWDQGYGPRAILACAPGEAHDLSLIIFGIALRRLGWRITFLGSNTPADSLMSAVRSLAPALVVVFAIDGARIRDAAAELTVIAAAAPLALAGPGAVETHEVVPGARILREDPVSAAGTVASGSFA
jgi:DNA-binding transcriptional MerR regulator